MKLPQHNEPAVAPIPAVGELTGDLNTRVAKVIDLMRPAIQADGGDVELVTVKPDGAVRVRFHGACVGCPSSTMTLRLGIEQNLRQHVPEVTAVESID